MGMKGIKTAVKVNPSEFNSGMNRGAGQVFGLAIGGVLLTVVVGVGNKVLDFVTTSTPKKKAATPRKRTPKRKPRKKAA